MHPLGVVVIALILAYGREDKVRVRGDHKAMSNQSSCRIAFHHETGGS